MTDASSSSLKITVKESILINAPPEAVWDYTQDWSRRREWDDSVLEVLSQSDGPPKRVRARFQGGAIFTVEYKLNDRPRQTSLAMQEGNSRWLIGGGGSWRYEAKEGGTEWTQVNTVVLPGNIMTRVLGPLLRASLRRSARKAMRKAKGLIERTAG